MKGQLTRRFAFVELYWAIFAMSDDGTFSQSSQSSLSIDDENMPENVIRPYQFEPEFSSSEESVEEEGDLEGEQQHEDENFRTGNLDW